MEERRRFGHDEQNNGDRRRQGSARALNRMSTVHSQRWLWLGSTVVYDRVVYKLRAHPECFGWPGQLVVLVPKAQEATRMPWFGATSLSLSDDSCRFATADNKLSGPTNDSMIEPQLDGPMLSQPTHNQNIKFSTFSITQRIQKCKKPNTMTIIRTHAPLCRRHQGDPCGLAGTHRSLLSSAFSSSTHSSRVRRINLTSDSSPRCK